uniref:Probable DNA polymerase n=2 Tax=Epichloe TaxID=5112 RepID=A0A1J0D0J6_EPINE|nr:hypothetical protein [Epichloe festucae]APB96839.1 hypothetical protein [Epichloe festucae]APB96899.1 hypothetical protein [Epichloe hybrida]
MSFSLRSLHKIADIFYIDSETKNSDLVICNMLDTMFKYDVHTYYCHNLANSDLYYILKTSIKYPNIYTFYPTFKYNIIKIIISKMIGKKKVYITISDSYTILNSSLAKLAKTFNVSTLKGNFSHDFANENTLFYIGYLLKFKIIRVLI